MQIHKWKLYAALSGLMGLCLSDQPCRAVPQEWQHGLMANETGRFVIRREGEVTLKFVNARLSAGNLELIPVPFYSGRGPATESIKEIARRFGLQTRRSVVAAVNGGFFDTKTGLPIGFLLRDERMEFFNMPQGFTRSMVGFRAASPKSPAPAAVVSSPREMPKVWIEALLTGPGQGARMRKLPVHHVNIPSGKHALALFTPTYGKHVPLPGNAVFFAAHPEKDRPGVFRIARRQQSGRMVMPDHGLIIALYGDSRSRAGMLNVGALIRPRWSLPREWQVRGITHGLLAGPRLLENGRIQVTAKTERLHALKSRDRVALGIKPNGDMVLLWAHKNTPGDLSFEKLARVLSDMGVTEAIGLDGGRSRAILAQSGGALASERYFEGGRPVANALVLAVQSTTRT